MVHLNCLVKVIELNFERFEKATYLNTMVGTVGHDDGVVRADREASRPGKASGFAPPHPELEQLPPLQQVMTPPTVAGSEQQGGRKARYTVPPRLHRSLSDSRALTSPRSVTQLMTRPRADTCVTNAVIRHPIQMLPS